MICAAVPESVSVPLPFAPAEMVAPPDKLTLTTPLVTLNCVVLKLPSGSLADTPVMVNGVSSAMVCTPGTTLTGARLFRPKSMAKLLEAIWVTSALAFSAPPAVV